jgi:hypothetical protein
MEHESRYGGKGGKPRESSNHPETKHNNGS